MTSSVDVVEEVRQNFLDSSYEVNANRAFPDVRDGCKPGQRCVIWEMYRKGYSSSKPHIKSAKVSGGVAASWWPHGTTAIYETFVRMSQPFSNNIPEIDFHGANGNVILGGDSFGADRYTEVRLSPMTEEGMLAGIDKNNVPMTWNFSEDELMPRVLPAIFPRLLVNGCQGIGVGLSNYWALHNFEETVKVIKDYLEEKEIDYDSYLPDFPTGGTIINKNELGEINRTGKGKIVLEANYEIKGKEIIFYEMPYQVYIEPVIEKIKECVDKGELNEICGVYNKSDKKQIALVIECVSANDCEHVVEKLFSFTPLRTQINVAQNGLISKTPRMFTLDEYLEAYTNHNLECIVKEHEFDFGKARARIEILEGLSRALEDIENIINLIKTSKSAAIAREELIKKYDFTENQAKAILDMRLARLANMEKVEITKELQEKREFALKCQKIIDSKQEQKKVLLERLQSLVKKHKSPRRTQVTQKVIVKHSKSVKEKAAAIPQEVVVTFNKNGYLQNIPLNSYKGVKEGIITAFKAQTDELLLLFSNLGNVFRIQVADIPQCAVRDKGTAVGSVLKMGTEEKILNAFSMNINEAHPYITGFTKGGLVKKSDKTIYIGSTRNITGQKAAGLNDGDEYIGFYESNGDLAIVGSSTGSLICFELDSVRTMGKTAKGIKSIALGEGETVSSVAVVPKSTKEIKINGEKTTITVQGRAGKGRKIANAPVIIGD